MTIVFTEAIPEVAEANPGIRTREWYLPPAIRPVVSDPRSSLNNASPSPSKKSKTDGNAAVAFELSRELTHAEIWNDSVLINAWEAVHEEYTAYHGGDTALKTNPITVVEENVTEDFPSQEEDDDDDGDSKPVDFNTFVPSHDASLDTGDDPVVGPSYSLPEPPTETVSQDEAFTRAVNAMYCARYWTAMYQCQRSDIVEAEEDEVEGMVSEFVSTQR
ncbi:hypothetical protein ARMSODRAFT_1025256 [Armillaria solidipes]|uniref:Uncharacterized protein n=1 Tax=Armillaria solidipes TaxID=1076256 RepID=A0A2H3AWK4_9AGAR|nr:hypothetical protein ARMSODRAFT_1025256 [Armillaria solidipes]